MYLFRAFIAGLVVPSIILPVALLLAWWGGNEKFIGVLPLHMLPIIWGGWNVLYFTVCRGCLPGSVNTRLWITGGTLGLLVALIGVFILDVTEIVGIPHQYRLYPIVIAPIGYGIIWRYFVKQLNEAFGLSN